MFEVVFGPHYDDVAQIAPPNSFIHAEQFDEAADLGNARNGLGDGRGFLAGPFDQVRVFLEIVNRLALRKTDRKGQ